MSLPVSTDHQNLVFENESKKEYSLLLKLLTSFTSLKLMELSYEMIVLQQLLFNVAYIIIDWISSPLMTVSKRVGNIPTFLWRDRWSFFFFVQKPAQIYIHLLIYAISRFAMVKHVSLFFSAAYAVSSYSLFIVSNVRTLKFAMLTLFLCLSKLGLFPVADCWPLGLSFYLNITSFLLTFVTTDAV